MKNTTDIQVPESETPADMTRSSRFFRKLDWSAFWTATALSFVVYLWTLAPTVTLEDSGELAVAGDYLGVPHPPGYPIWSLFAWIFSRIFHFVQFRGQPNPAWGIGLMSAFFGALSVGMAAMLICRSGSDILHRSRQAARLADRKTENVICWVGGVVGSLLFAFSPVMWSQSVIVEVYSLNAFFLVLIFLLTYQWMCRPTRRLLWTTAFLFGLGLTNYQVLLLAGLPLVFVIFLRDIRLFRDFLVVGLPFALTLVLIRTEILPKMGHPLNATAFVYLSLNFVVLILAYFFLPNGRTVAITFLLVELGVAFYAYMPLVSDLRNPPMNWGYPRTWEGFKHAIGRRQYEAIVPTDVFSIRFIHQIGTYLSDLRMQFTILAAPLGFLPFTTWQIRAGRRRLQALYAAIGLTAAAVTVAMFERFVLPGSGLLEATYKTLFLGVLALLLIGGVAIFVNQASELLQTTLGKTRASISERIVAAVVLLMAILVLLVYIAAVTSKLGDITAALRKPDVSLPVEKLWAIVGQIVGVIGFILAPPAIIALVAWLMRSRCRLRLTIDAHSQKWIIATLLGFIAMSIMLIALANPKADIQDTFIQRVKFISSHVLYALWIGYGLMFALGFVNALFRHHRLVKWATVGVALMLPLVPIHQNAFQRELIRRSGGAEQNGHDFGWQFGNYELRGAEAMSEELSPDEEPLPNPYFPESMGTNAVFFGGTDPGRFVPTYMIYSARVREDVFLITQNALADNTYMSVMRDLYGDQIWIPSQMESALAFRRYVDEVQSGKREPHAALKIENGRVQVSGALGVMVINGILAEMIFDHNKYRHDFYVEESYVIPWMYPYLTPHGLIMKINSDKTDLAPETVRNDMDFWDWYERRLTSDSKFMRDVVARKSFSKLRSAIAGLYVSRRMMQKAETAFHEAGMLYPLSPEANFRLVQEVLMPLQRFKEAREIMADFGRRDPGNEKVDQFLNQLSGFEDMHTRIKTLESLLAKGSLDANRALELATLYRKTSQKTKFSQLTGDMLNNTNLPPVFYYRLAEMFQNTGMMKDLDLAVERFLNVLPPNVPPEVYLDIAKLYGECQRAEPMSTYLKEYLDKKPSNWQVWLNLASAQIALGNDDAAVKSLEQAVRFGGQNALSVIRQENRFASLRSRIRRQQPLLQLPRVPPRR